MLHLLGAMQLGFEESKLRCRGKVKSGSAEVQLRHCSKFLFTLSLLLFKILHYLRYFYFAFSLSLTQVQVFSEMSTFIVYCYFTDSYCSRVPIKFERITEGVTV